LGTVVNVDAFNLYYGTPKGTPYKRLNLDPLRRVRTGRAR
jgi:hypothetical protein